MKLQPLHDRLLVREIKPTRSSILLVPDLVDDGLVKELVEGEVIAVGPGLKTQAGKRGSMWDLAPGLIVKFSPVCSVTVEGGLTLIRRDAVAGVVV